MFRLGGGALYEFLPCRQVKSDRMDPQNETLSNFERKEGHDVGPPPFATIAEVGPNSWANVAAALGRRQQPKPEYPDVISSWQTVLLFSPALPGSTGGALTCCQADFSDNLKHDRSSSPAMHMPGLFAIVSHLHHRVNWQYQGRLHLNGWRYLFLSWFGNFLGSCRQCRRHLCLHLNQCK